MECSIYKGKRKPGHYVFLPAEKTIDEIPDAIQQMMGEIEHVMDIDITLDTKLAQSNPVDIINMVTEKGFYIQMPPENDNNVDREEY